MVLALERLTGGAAVTSLRRGCAERPLVLIVDDDQDTRVLHAELLAARGFRTITAEDGESAVADSLAAKPDIILMDGAMPGLSGVEAAERIRGDIRTAAIRIVMLTGFERSGLSRAGGVDAHLTKPSTADDIARTLRSVLARC